MKKLAVILINFYQLFFSFLFIGGCKYSPTCSQYTKEAVVRFGFAKGLILGARRILSCR